jgi:HPt (histidine-containing phosphotransfer) domain-containing protein
LADLARTLEQFLTSPEHQPETAPAAPLAETAFKPVPVADFDISHLLELEDPEFIRQIFDIFTEKIPSFFQELKSCLPDGNWVGFLEKAHKIRGSFSFIQIPQIYQLLLAMEAKVQAQKNLAEVEPLLENCLSLYTGLIPAIHQEMDKQLIALETNL